MTVVEPHDVGILLGLGYIVGSGLAPESTLGVQFTPLDDNRQVKRRRPDGFVKSGLGRIPLLPLHEAPGAGRGIGTEEDRVEPLFGACLGWTSQLHQLFAALEPGRVVENLDEALMRVEPQLGNHLNSGRHALRLIGQVRPNGNEA